MKTIVITIGAILCLAFNSFGQDNKMINFGVELTPKFSSQNYQQQNISNWKTFNFSISGNLFYQINNFLELKSGLSVSKITTNHFDQSLFFFCDLEIFNNDSKTYLREFHESYYLGLPVDLRWKLNQTKHPFYLKVGGEYLFKVSQSSVNHLSECGEIEMETDFFDAKKVMNRSLLKLRSGFGYEFGLMKNIRMYLEPQVEFSITNLYSDFSIQSELDNSTNIVDVGLVMGLRF